MSQELPTSFTIFDDVHFPPVDNQGGIGSCASQAISRNQLTNAVSRILHEKNKKSAFCPKNNFGDVFTPKYSYNMAGPGTAWVYEFVSEHGALFQTEGIFKKAETGDPNVLGGSIPRDKNGVPEKQSAELLVKKGQMERALRYRVTHFEQIWVTKPPYNEDLTKNADGQALLVKIKESLLNGDAVVTGGYPGRWVYTTIENCGTLGKEGDKACVAAAGNGGGGHQVTIAGWDDGITAVFAGVRLQGAFLIVNSYGPGWQNKGLCWMFYDSVNTRSEFEALNDPSLYSGPMYITPASGFRMFPEKLTELDQKISFEKNGTFELYGKTYDAYTATDRASGKFLSYQPDKDDRSLLLVSEGALRFAFIPYEDMCAFPTSDKQYEKEEYKGSFWIYAADKEGGPEGFCVLDAGVSFSSSGRNCSLASHNAGRYPEAKSWLPDKKPGKKFISRLAIAAGKGVKSERIWTLDQFCFLDHRKDVAVGMPEYYVKATVSADDRDCFRILLTRKPKEGVRTKKHLPAMFRYVNCRPFYAKRGKNDYLNFEGVLNGPVCKGYLAFSLLPLLPKSKRFDDYVWGVELVKSKKGTAKLIDAALCRADGSAVSKKKGENNKIVF